jgi:hypothetical protein
VLGFIQSDATLIGYLLLMLTLMLYLVTHMYIMPYQKFMMNFSEICDLFFLLILTTIYFVYKLGDIYQGVAQDPAYVQFADYLIITMMLLVYFPIMVFVTSILSNVIGGFMELVNEKEFKKSENTTNSGSSSEAPSALHPSISDLFPNTALKIEPAPFPAFVSDASGMTSPLASTKLLYSEATRPMVAATVAPFIAASTSGSIFADLALRTSPLPPGRMPRKIQLDDIEAACNVEGTSNSELDDPSTPNINTSLMDILLRRSPTPTHPTAPPSSSSNRH